MLIRLIICLICLFVVSVVSNLGFEDRTLVLIMPVPGHYFPFTFKPTTTTYKYM